MVTPLLLRVRRPDLSYWGMIPPSHLISFECELIPRKVGSWTVVMDAQSPAARALATPGYGLVVTTPGGDVLVSGPTAERLEDYSPEDPDGIYTITGEDEAVIGSDRISYPTPATATVEDGAQAGTDASGYDQRTGNSGTLIGAYTRDNAGANAPAGRRIPQLDVAPDLALGASVSGEGRYQPLGELYEGLAQAGGTYHRWVQQGDRIVLTPYVPRDLSRLVRLSFATGTLEKASRTISRPKITRALVGLAGDDADRDIIEVTTDDSLAAEQLWGYAGAGRRIERFIESGGTEDPDLAPQAGIEALADEGKTIITVTADPIDTDKVQFGRDYYLGDKITVVIPGDPQPIVDVVSGVRVTWDSEGIVRRCVLGDPSTAIRDQTLRALISDRARNQRRLGRLERR